MTEELQEVTSVDGRKFTLGDRVKVRSLQVSSKFGKIIRITGPWEVIVQYEGAAGPTKAYTGDLEVVHPG